MAGVSIRPARSSNPSPDSIRLPPNISRHNQRPAFAYCGATRRARQLNAGAAASRCDVLLFLHADTQLPANARQTVSTALSDQARIGGRFNVRFDSPCLMAQVIATLMNLRSRLSGIATGDQAIFVRRDVFERIGRLPISP